MRNNIGRYFMITVIALVTVFAIFGTFKAMSGVEFMGIPAATDKNQLPTFKYEVIVDGYRPMFSTSIEVHDNLLILPNPHWYVDKAWNYRPENYTETFSGNFRIIELQK